MTEDYPRHHPSEGHGLRTAFFQYLLRTNAGSSSSPEVAIPDTVAFEHGFPRWWYQYDSKSKEVRRTAGGRDLQASSIYRYFKKSAPTIHGKAIGIVAIYTYLKRSESSKDTVCVEYHTKKSLQAFLLKGGDPRMNLGILQGVVVPLELNYTVMNVQWCPAVSVVRRRACLRFLSDVRSPTFDRFVTFEGPDYHSVEVQCAEPTKVRVLNACSRIADHFHRAHHLKVSSMQCFFLVDRNSDPVLLWCGSLYLNHAQRGAPGPAIPATLMAGPSFGPPSLGWARDEAPVEDLLRQSDAAQDSIAVSMGTVRSPKYLRGEQLLHSGDGQKSGPTTNSDAPAALALAGSGAAAASLRYKQRSKTAESIAELVYDRWYLVASEVKAEYEALVERERTATLAIDDVLYTAYSRFRSEDKAAAQRAPNEASVELPHELTRCLGHVEDVNNLLAAIHLQRSTTNSSAAEGSGGGVSTASRVEVAAPKVRDLDPVHLHPVPKLVSDAERWIHEFFAEKHRHLRLRCVPAIELAVAQASIMHFAKGVSVEEAVKRCTS